jgi:hypothetical protein
MITHVAHTRTHTHTRHADHTQTPGFHCAFVVIERNCEAGPVQARRQAQREYGMETELFTSYEICKRVSLPSHHETVRIGTWIRVGPRRVGIVCQLLEGTRGWLKIQLLKETTQRLVAPLSLVRGLTLENTFQFVPSSLDTPFVHGVHDCRAAGRHACSPVQRCGHGQARGGSFTTDPFRGHNPANTSFWLNPYLVD